MKILMINKFLHKNGGSETYILKLGEYLMSEGHPVEYFGMEHPKRLVGNRKNLYTSQMDFHTTSACKKLAYSLRTIYSAEARKKIRAVLEDFKPDVCHLNNFNYQLTPSILLEIRKWMRETGHACRIVYTAHDYQLLCPNHMCRNPNTHEICEKCLGGAYRNCFQNRCIHGSALKSLMGTLEADFWNANGVYGEIDTVICCSRFMKQMMDRKPVFAGKTVAPHNFIDRPEQKETKKKDYVLYFGRFSEEKGVRTLLTACKALPDIPFVFAGTGPLEELLETVPNVRNAGFLEGEALATLIREARFSVYPSEWYENGPFSVMESQLYQTPVLGAAIGGIPELIAEGESGELFPSGDAEALIKKIRALWDDKEKLKRYQNGCRNVRFDNVSEYAGKLMEFYREA